MSWQGDAWADRKDMFSSALRDGAEQQRMLNQKLFIMSEISSKVVDIIVEKLGVDASEAVPTASFTNDLGADSLDTVELIMEFEKEFGIQIPDEDAEKITTVGDAISYIESKKN